MPQTKQILIAHPSSEDQKRLMDLSRKFAPHANILTVATEHDVFKKIDYQKFDLLVSDLSITKGDPFQFFSKSLLPLSKDKIGWTILLAKETNKSFDTLKKHSFLLEPLDESLFGEILTTICGPIESKAKSSIDVAFINPFIEATLKVFSTTANVVAKKKSVTLRQNNQISGDISSLIAMNSDRYLGSMAISFEEKCFLGIVGQMLGETYETITPEIQDAAGELCNQIFGQAKMELNLKGHTIQAAIPSIITGKGHQIRHLLSGHCIAITFETSYGDFVIETIMRERV